MFMVQKELPKVELTEYEQLLVSFKPRRIESLDDSEYDRVQKQCKIYFDRDSDDSSKCKLNNAEEMFYNLLCTLISEVDNRMIRQEQNSNDINKDICSLKVYKKGN